MQLKIGGIPFIKLNKIDLQAGRSLQVLNHGLAGWQSRINQQPGDRSMIIESFEIIERALNLK